LFRPAAAGSVDAASGSGGGVTVNLNLPAGADATGLLRSEAQVAQALARAVALGRR
ncbi:MAG: phage tail tape measure protein, partial [Caulobacteraceae bacterium]|nr:phage tail tape measure protein [Caulobacter sp.]